MIDALLAMALPGVPVMNGETARPAAPGAEGFGAALALLLAPKPVLAPGDTAAVLPDAMAVEAVAGPPQLPAQPAMPLAVAAGEGQPVAVVGAAAVAGGAAPVGEPADRGVVPRRPERVLPMAVGRAPLAEAAAGGSEPRVERRLKNGSDVKPLAEAGEMIMPLVPAPVVLPVVLPVVGLVAASVDVATPGEVRLVPPQPVTIPAAVAAPMIVPPVVTTLAETPTVMAAVVPVNPAAVPLVPALPVPPGDALPIIAGAPVVDTGAGVVPAVVIEAGRRASSVPDIRPVSEKPVPPARFMADLPLSSVVAALVPEPRGDGVRREIDGVPVVEPVVSAAASVGLPGVSGGNPVVRGGSGDGSPVAPPVPAAGEQQFSVASDALGPVDIGVDGGGEDLRVRFSADAGAARVMAAEAPRLLADLAAQGVRVQALAFDGRAEPGTAPGLAAGADGSPAQQSPGQPGGQPGFAAARQAAALPEPAVTGSGAGSRIPRISERYA